MSEQRFATDDNGERIDAGALDRKRYRFWWEHALRSIRQVSVTTWAHRAVERYCQLHDQQFSGRDRLQLLKQAMDAALKADGRFIGDWSTERGIEMSRLSDEAVAPIMREIDARKLGEAMLRGGG